MTDARSLGEVFEAHLPAARRALAATGAALEPTLAALVDAARREWPGLSLDAPDFVAALARRAPPDGPLTDWLATLRAADLYLAEACARADPAALAAIEAKCFAQADLAVARTASSAADAQDVIARLRHKLFVGDGTTPPRIGTYAGRGDLCGFVRVAAVREAIELLRRQRREPSAGDDALENLAAAGQDPEIGYLKRLYRTEFKSAFGEALTALAPRERNLLRYHFVEGLSVDELGAMYRVHRSTAARQVARTRDALLAATRRALMARLHIGRREFESIMRLISSQLDVSVATFLDGEREAEDPPDGAGA